MDQKYIESLEDQLLLECHLYGRQIYINDFPVNALISTSATTKSLQIAGFYKNQTLDVVIPKYKNEPKINNIILFNGKTYQIKQIEDLEYEHGYRITMELIT